MSVAAGIALLSRQCLAFADKKTAIPAIMPNEEEQRHIRFCMKRLGKTYGRQRVDFSSGASCAPSLAVHENNTSCHLASTRRDAYTIAPALTRCSYCIRCNAACCRTTICTLLGPRHAGPFRINAECFAGCGIMHQPS